MSASEKRRGKLENRVAVISGGAQGIGRAIAECFQREGASVVLLDCEADTAARAAQELTECQSLAPVSSVRVDLGNPKEIHEAVDRVKDLYGRIDILVNNAGI